MKTHQTPTDHCPWCGHEVDRVSSVTNDDAAPAPGDATFCIRCLGPSVFEGSPLKMRKATQAEAMQIAEAAPHVIEAWRSAFGGRLQ